MAHLCAPNFKPWSPYVGPRAAAFGPERSGDSTRRIGRTLLAAAISLLTATVALPAPAAALPGDPTIRLFTSEPDTDNLTIEFRGLICTGPPSGPLVFEFANGALVQTASLDTCAGRWTPEYLTGLKWRLPLVGPTSYSPPTAYLKLSGGARGVRRFRYRATIDGELVDSDTLKVTTRRTKSRRYWQGQDAFVNYCINRSRPIYSEHGRLYCTRPSELYRAFTLGSGVLIS